MNPKLKLYRPEYALDLLDIAAGDYSSAKVLAAATEGRRENVCYLAQQCVEKCIKAVTCASGKPIFHSHDIDSLVAMLPGDELPPEEHRLGALTEFSLVRRYENGYSEVTPDDTKEALRLAAQVLSWAQNMIERLLPGSRART